MNTIRELCKTADGIDAVLKRLDRIRQHAGGPLAASVAAFTAMQLQRINDRLMFACDEIASRDESEAA